jgi:hypothetical protein
MASVLTLFLKNDSKFVSSQNSELKIETVVETKAFVFDEFDFLIVPLVA